MDRTEGGGGMTEKNRARKGKRTPNSDARGEDGGLNDDYGDEGTRCATIEP